LNGLTYGEEKNGIPNFWWRKQLREYAERMAALSPAKQEQPDFEALAKQYADKIEQNMPKYNREFSAEQVIYYAKKDYLAGLKSGYVAALPYTEENPG